MERRGWRRLKYNGNKKHASMARDHKESRKTVLEDRVHNRLYHLGRRRISNIQHVLALLGHHQISVITKIFSENYM